MKIFFVLISTLTLFNFSAMAQSKNRREEIDREIEAIMKARDEMIRSLLDDSAFSNFDDHFNNLVKKFEHDSFGVMPEQQMGAVVGEYDWRETETQQILVIKVKQIKDRPLDIKIEKGFVRLKGDVEEVQNYPSRKGKKISKVHFERSFSIPDGVDQTAPEFENKDGELLIKFRKLTLSKAGQERAPVKSDKSVKQGLDREPVARDSDDPVI